MPPLFLPDIESLADSNPLLYEIFYQIQQSINNIPISAGAAAPSPQPSLDPKTGAQLTDANGNLLFTIPQNTNPTSSTSAGSAAVPANESNLYLQTDPAGQASSAFLFGGTWQRIFKILRASDLAGVGAPGKKFIVPGYVIPQSSVHDIHGRPSASFFTNVTDNAFVPTSGNPLSQSGTSTTILVAATTWQLGGFQISYNSGSVNPGAFGTYQVFFDDPLYVGGVAVFQTVLSPGGFVQLSKRGRFYLGQIATSGGGGGTGSGGGSADPKRFLP